MNKPLFAPLHAGIVAVCLAVGPTAFAQSQSQSQASSSSGSGQLLAYEQNTVKIAKQAKPSVVAINVTVKGQRVDPLANMPPEMRQFFKQFGGMTPEKRQRTERAAGSGFVIDGNGEVLTNFHVIAGALDGDSTDLKDKATVTVQFGGGEQLPVKVVGVDQSYDLALLALKDSAQLPDNAKALQLANSDDVQVGQKTIAIGNPFTLESTVTQGIVSAINREQAAKVSGVPISYIQTDAAINPGSSGGPLLDSQGKVIGINNEILAPSGTFIGVGLAIPSDLIKDNLDQLKKGGFIKKAMIGVAIQPLEDYPDAVRRQLNLPNNGLMIVKVKQGSPGDKAGLKGAEFTVNAGGRRWPAGGDIIVKADGKEITSVHELQNIVFDKSKGDTVDLVVMRGGEQKEISVKLAVLKSSDQAREKG